MNGGCQELTLKPATVNPNKIAFMAKITVEAPTELTDESIDDGVEEIPVPIIRPTLA